MRTLHTIRPGTRREWRAWLRKNHRSSREVWLVFEKRRTGRPSIPYGEAVEEAICFGWIDSLIRRLDGDRYARKFTPRRPGSRWSDANRRRYAEAGRRGRLAAAGRKAAPGVRSGNAPRPPLSRIPRDVERALKASPPAWENFRRLPPSRRRAYLGWIGSAKRAETRERRLREAAGLLAAGRRLGMK